MLSASQLEQYHKDGYLVVPDFFTLDTAHSLKSHADVIQQQLDFASHPRTVFRTTDTNSNSKNFSQCESKSPDESKSSPSSTPPSSKAANDRYFLDSADRVSFFFEEGAFDADGRLLVPQSQSINKVGHALHVLDPVFSAFSLSPRVLSLALQLGFHDPILLQSMLIFKHPRIGGLVSKHRDSTFLYTEPSTAVGFWFALEDCTRSNGTLSFVKGSHRDGAAHRRLRRTGERVASVNQGVVGAKGPMNEGVVLAFTGEDAKVDVYPDEEWTMEEVKAGSLVLIHGDVVHASGHNHSAASRYIYTFHLIDGEGTRYSEDNWLQSSQPFTRLRQAAKAEDA